MAVENITSQLQINWQITETLPFLGTSSNPTQNFNPTYAYTNGTGTGSPQLIDLHFEKSYTLAAAGTVTINLNTLVDNLSRTLNFVSVSGLLIYTTARTGGDYLSVAPSGISPFTQLGSYTVYGAELKIFDLTDGLNCSGAGIFTITNSGSHSITFNLLIQGRSA